MVKLTDKDFLTTPSDNDVLHIVDVSDLTGSPYGTSKKITRKELIRKGWSIEYYASLNDAVADIGAVNATLLINKTTTLTADLTVPDNITLKFEKPGIVSGAYTLTINGGIEAGLYKIFDTSTGLVVDGSPQIEAVCPEWFGAVGDGINDDTSAISQMFTMKYTRYVFSNIYLMTDDISLDIIADFQFDSPANIVIDASHAQFIYTGTGYPFHFYQSSSPPNSNRLHWIGGWFEGNSSAAGCFKLDDIIASVFVRTMVRNFNSGIAFHLRNVVAWSEQNTFIDVKIAEVGRMFQFDPASVTGGTGTSSFARTSIINLKGGAAEYWIYNNGGGVYDSLFFGLYGNLGTQCKAVAYLSGGMGGTVISNIGVEQGDPAASYIFEIGTFIGAPPIVSNYHGQQVVGTFNGDYSVLGGIQSPKIDTEGLYSTGTTGLAANIIASVVDGADYGGMFQSNTSVGTDALAAYGHLILQPRTSQGRNVYFYTAEFGNDNAPRARIDWEGVYSYGGVKSNTDVTVETAGKGIVVTSPDGLTTLRIGIDNTGAIVTTAP